jgi:hypothetical protein
MAVQYRRPQFLKKSLAAISPFSVFRASPPQAELAWRRRVQIDGSSRRGLGRSGRTGWANGW